MHTTTKSLHWRDGLALTLYILLTLLISGSLLGGMNQIVAGWSEDVYINLWADWWTAKALTEGLDFYHTDYLFYPHGTSVVFYSFSHTNTLVSLALAPLLGRLAAYNVTVLLAFVLSGWSMYLLVRHITACRPAAFVAGLVFAFQPYHVYESGHPVLFTTQWMPLFILALVRLLRGSNPNRVRQVFWAALWFLLTALSSWHLMIMLAAWTILYVGYCVFIERRNLGPRALGHLLLLAAITTAVVFPFIWPILREQVTTDASYAAVDATSGVGNDLLSFVTPNAGNPWLGPLVEKVNDRLSFLLRNRSGYLGYIPLLLSAAGLVAAWRKARFWLLSDLLFLVLSLGLHVNAGGEPLHAFSLPWAIPVINVLRHPFRLNVLVSLSLAVLTGIGSHWLYKSIQGGERFKGMVRHGRFAPCLTTPLKRLLPKQGRLYNLVASRSAWGAGLMLIPLTILIMAEYLVYPFPTRVLSCSPFYERLAREDGDFAVVSFPMGRTRDKHAMFYQTIHGKRIVGGVVSRTPHKAYAFVYTHPLLGPLFNGNAPDAALDINEQFSRLAEQNIRYIIFQKHFLEEDGIQDWRDWLSGFPEPYYEDDRLLAYRTTAAPVHVMRPGMGVIEAALSTETVSPEAVLEIEVAWGATTPPDVDLDAEIALVDGEGRAGQTYRFPISPPTGEWPAGTVVWERYACPIEPWLPGGTYAVTLSLVHGEGGQPVGQSVVAGEVTMLSPERSFAPPAVAHPSDAIFGEDLRLLGHDVQVRPDAIHLTLHWQGLGRMETAFKFFVHLYDSETGTLVAQADVMPHDWAYPTTWWEAGEFVSDEIVLAVAGIPPGAYRLAVGVYVPDSGERVPITDQQLDLRIDRGRLFLSEIEID